MLSAPVPAIGAAMFTSSPSSVRLWSLALTTFLRSRTPVRALRISAVVVSTTLLKIRPTPPMSPWRVIVPPVLYSCRPSMMMLGRVIWELLLILRPVMVFWIRPRLVVDTDPPPRFSTKVLVLATGPPKINVPLPVDKVSGLATSRAPWKSMLPPPLSIVDAPETLARVWKVILSLVVDRFTPMFATPPADTISSLNTEALPEKLTSPWDCSVSAPEMLLLLAGWMPSTVISPVTAPADVVTSLSPPEVLMRSSSSAEIAMPAPVPPSAMSFPPEAVIVTLPEPDEMMLSPVITRSAAVIEMDLFEVFNATPSAKINAPTPSLLASATKVAAAPNDQFWFSWISLRAV